MFAEDRLAKILRRDGRAKMHRDGQSTIGWYEATSRHRPQENRRDSKAGSSVVRSGRSLLGDRGNSAKKWQQRKRSVLDR